MRPPDTVDDASPRPSLMLGRVLDGRYQIDAVLGEGGLGQVFRATDRRLSRPVAIKVMHAQHVSRAELRARFEREARSLAALSHPNVVGVVDYGVDGDVPFLVMELLEGKTLEAAMADGLPISRVLPIVRDVLRAVAYAHAQGLVHRDLKPANVFLQSVPEIGDVVRVLDFGLAKFIDDDPTAGPALTRAGMVLGTPAYMSPEQATGGVVDARADVYALGILLFELAMGERPFRATDGPELLRQHLLTEMPPMTGKPDREIRPELEAIVRRASAKSRVDRFKDAAEMAAALDALPTDALRGLGPAASAVVTGPRKSAVPSSLESDATMAAPADASKTLASSPNDPPAATAPATRPHMPAPKASLGRARAALPKRALAVLVLASLLGVGIWWLARTEPEQERAPWPVEAAPVVPTVGERPPPTKRTVPGPSAPETTAGPFDAPTPSQLVAIETRVREGRPITSEQRRTLFRYSTNHPHDARGWLLMGHADFLTGARTDACGRYERAFASDEASRNDETMRHDLLVMAGHRAVTTTATRMVVEIYGARALPHLAAVEQELASDRDAVRRLHALRRRLERTD